MSSFFTPLPPPPTPIFLYPFLTFMFSCLSPLKQRISCILVLKMAQFPYRAATCERTGELYVCVEMALKRHTYMHISHTVNHTYKLLYFLRILRRINQLLAT